MATKYKLDIFKTLTYISKKDTMFYDKLTEEEQKGFFPLIVSRWLSGTSSARQVFFLNELVNRFVFSLQKHKQLLYFLMTTCTSGKPQRYFWNKTHTKKSSKTPVSIDVIKQYFKYNTMNAIEVLPLLTKDDIIIYAEHLGRQKEDITKIKKELKQHDESKRSI